MKYRVSRGLLYKTLFLPSEEVRNQINVNPLFSRQKGAFSSFPEVFCREVNPHFIFAVLYRPEDGRHTL
ncbi:hypothetical protein H8784_16385 [Parabacteroides acidifaciens]|uniref:Uncharacterized protein n=1 Tax=Parabacteroides acidifaciens TaxID=2290935 RepID=A0ABR7P4J7_9BACT|nr:hypothetical protein [Parabacteroides acidifaciens]MBC8603292.1 hypothetical protein [Parabacteroides acidifaciens]